MESREKKKQKTEKIFSVSDYIKIINQKLKKFGAKIIGEVSEVNFGRTGHVYFSLKDEEDQSVIRCIVWKSKYATYGIDLKEGLKIIATGCPSIYAKRGNFSFISDVIEHAGEGALKKAYEKLKKKLTIEGIFEESKKRPIPKYPQKIGVITARQGSVIHDFLNNLGRFGFKVKMVDSRVEGQIAATDLLLSIKTLKKKDIEVLVIMRGGGSLESMLAFNNESLVREIANFPVPVIAAIGHDKDVPLVALAADLSVSTPSIAATTLNETWEKAALLIREHERNIIDVYEDALDDILPLLKEYKRKIIDVSDNIFQGAELIIKQSMDTIRNINDFIFDEFKETETRLKVSFRGFQSDLQNCKNNLENLWSKILLKLKSSFLIINQELEHSEKVAYLNNPETQLKLGYSLVKRNNKLIKSVQDTKIGQNLDIYVTDGTIASQVKNINKK